MVPKCKAGWQGSDLVSGGLLGGEQEAGGIRCMVPKCKAGWQGSELVSGVYWGGVRGRWHPMHGSKLQSRVAGV